MTILTIFTAESSIARGDSQSRYCPLPAESIDVIDNKIKSYVNSQLFINWYEEDTTIIGIEEGRRTNFIWIVLARDHSLLSKGRSLPGGSSYLDAFQINKIFTNPSPYGPRAGNIAALVDDRADGYGKKTASAYSQATFMCGLSALSRVLFTVLELVEMYLVRLYFFCSILLCRLPEYRFCVIGIVSGVSDQGTC